MKPTILRVVASAALMGALAGAALAQTTDAAPANAEQLIARWTGSDAACRNQAAPAVDAVGACEQRDTFSKPLTLMSCCHGPAGTTGPATWTPCGGNPAAGQPSAKAVRDSTRARATAPFQRVGGVFVLSALLNGATQTYFIVDFRRPHRADPRRGGQDAEAQRQAD